MDDKQYIAYEVICCTFLLQLIYEVGDANTNLGGYLRATLHSERKESLIRKLMARSAKEQCCYS